MLLRSGILQLRLDAAAWSTLRIRLSLPAGILALTTAGLGDGVTHYVSARQPPMAMR